MRCRAATATISSITMRADNMSQVNGGTGFDSLAFLGAWQAINLPLYGFEQALAITTDTRQPSLDDCHRCL